MSCHLADSYLLESSVACMIAAATNKARDEGSSKSNGLGFLPGEQEAQRRPQQKDGSMGS